MTMQILKIEKKIYVYASIFDCTWITVGRGRRPDQLFYVFFGVLNSCMKQIQEAKRTQ